MNTGSMEPIWDRMMIVTMMVVKVVGRIMPTTAVGITGATGPTETMEVMETTEIIPPRPFGRSSGSVSY